MVMRRTTLLRLARTAIIAACLLGSQLTCVQMS
jgi:hypothetical protein